MKNYKPGDPASGIVSLRRNRPAACPQDLQVDELLALAERITSARENRKNFFDGDLFAEPSWEILVHLFHADLIGYRVTVTNLSIASGVPYTTALRWMDTLQERGLVARRENPLDRRSVFIEITQSARAAMYDYLCTTWATYYA